MDKQLRTHGVPYRFFDAIDGRAGYRASFEAYDRSGFILRTGRSARPGEIGCFASHRELWKDCAAGPEPFIILEDDLDLSADFASALGVVGRLVPRFGFIRLQAESHARSLKLMDTGRYALHFYTKVPHGAAGYCISPEVAARFVAATRTLSMPVDVFIKRVWEHKQPIFGLLPYAVDLNWMAGRSTIGPRPKHRKSLPERSARIAEKLRAITSRSRFNRGATRRL